MIVPGISDKRVYRHEVMSPGEATWPRILAASLSYIIDRELTTSGNQLIKASKSLQVTPSLALPHPIPALRYRGIYNLKNKPILPSAESPEPQHQHNQDRPAPALRPSDDNNPADGLTLSCATHAVFERASPLFFELFLAERYLVSNQELNM